MPLAPTLPTTQILQPAKLPEAVAAPRPALSETAFAAFDLNSSLGALRRWPGINDPYGFGVFGDDMEPAQAGYTPFDDPQTADLQGDEWLAVANSDSPAETARHLRDLMDERKARDVLARSGGTGIAMSIAAGVLDPLTLLSIAIPVAAPATMGTRGTRIALGVAASMATDAAAEVAFHYGQPMRTWKDSALNIGAGALLTGVLGAVATRVPKSEFELVEQSLRKDLQAAPDGSLSAARADTGAFQWGAVKLEDLDMDTTAARAAAKGMNWFLRSPTLNIMQRPFVEARKLLLESVHLPWAVRGNVEKALVNPTALETVANQMHRKRLVDLLVAERDLYSKYVQKAKGTGKVLRRREFGHLAVWAARGEKVDIAEAGELGRILRGTYDADRAALRELTAAAGEAPFEGLDNYVTQMWDMHALRTNQPLFVEKMKKFLQENPILPEDTPEIQAARTRVADEGNVDTPDELVSVVAARDARKQAADAGLQARKATAADNEARANLSKLEDRVQQEASDLEGLKAERARLPQEIDRHNEEVARLTLENRSAVDDARILAQNKQAAQKALEDNRAQVSKAADDLKVAERESDSIAQELYELETRRAGLAEDIADPDKVRRAEATLDAKIERVKRRGHAAEARRQDAMNRVVEAEQTRDRLKAQLQDVRTALTEAGATVKDTRKALKGMRTKDPGALLDSLDKRIAARQKRIDALGGEIDAARKAILGPDKIADMKAIAKEVRAASRDAFKKAKEARDAASKVRAYNKAMKAAQELQRDDAELADEALNIYNNILGTHRGTLHTGTVHNPRVMRERKLNINPKDFQEFLVSDFDQIIGSYNRTMMPRIAAYKMGLDDASWKARLQAVTDEAKVLATANPEKGAEIMDQLGKTVQDLERIRARILNQVGPTGASGAEQWVRASRIMRSYNYMRLLGGQVMSSVPDLGHVVTRYGMMPTMRKLARYVGSPEFRKLSKAQANRLGAAANAILDTRVGTLADIGDPLMGGRGVGAALERGTEVASTQFSRLTLMTAWNDMLQAMTVSLESDAILRAAKNYDALSAFKRGQLAAAGFDEDTLRRLATMPVIDEDGLLRAGTDAWTDRALAEKFNGAMSSAADVMTISRGAGDLPLIMDYELAKIMLQFKSFGMAAVNRVTIPTLQGLAHRDKATYQGLVMMLTLGATVNATKDIVAGREPSTEPDDLIRGAANWSGVFAFLPDVVDPILALSPEPLRGLRSSKYTNRGPVETFLGPSIGTAGDVFGAISGVTGPTNEWDDTPSLTARELHQLRKLVPLQNHFALRQIINAVEGETAETLGLQGSVPRDFADRLTTLEEPK